LGLDLRRNFWTFPHAFDALESSLMFRTATDDGGTSLIALESLAAIYGSDPLSAAASAVIGITSASPAEFQGDSAVLASDLHDFITQEAPRAGRSLARSVLSAAPTQESTLDEEFLGEACNWSTGIEQWFWVERGWMFEWTEALEEQQPR